jgi:hypothetical protein
MIEFLARMPTDTKIFLTMAVLALAAMLVVLRRLIVYFTYVTATLFYAYFTVVQEHPLLSSPRRADALIRLGATWGMHYA